MKRVVGAIKLTGDVFEITADPDVVIRLKRILPAIATGRRDVLHLSATEPNCRDLEWITDRWLFDIADDDRVAMQRLADDDVKREELVQGIISGTDTFTPAEGWLTPRTPLYDYQRVAVDLARASKTLVIGDELGGGKTAMSLGLLEDPANRPALAVILTGLGKQWLRELDKFYPQLRGYELRTTKANEEFPKLCGDDGEIGYDLILVNYAKLAAWRHHLAGKVRAVMFDEVQELRIQGSLKYEAAAHISSEARIRVGCSATPVYNYGGEIFSIMDALEQGCLGTEIEFTREWTWGYGTKTRVREPEALRAHLQSRGLFIRRTLDQMGIAIPGALPIEHVVPSDTAKYEELSGNAIEMAKLIMSQDATNSEKWRTSAELDWRLRQATGIAKASYVADFVKLLLSSEEKVVLFGWHRSVYDIWLERLAEFNPVLYTGTESSNAKSRNVDRFLKGDSRVLIISLRSGAGLDGLQLVSSTIVFGELDWSPGVHRQCIGRLYRPGQKHKVLAYFCVSTDGSDPVILDVLNIKAMEAQSLTGAGDTVGARPADASQDQIKQLARSVLERAGVEVPA